MSARTRTAAVFAAVVMSGLAANVWLHDGLGALLILLLAGGGLIAVVIAVGWAQGAAVVQHAYGLRAIEAVRPKQIVAAYRGEDTKREEMIP